MIYWFEHRGMRYRIHEGETLIGRGGRSALFVDVPSVSREHALVRRRGNELEITDLGSSNGTWVNGERVMGSRTLRSGDEIKLGAAVLTLGKSPTIEPAIVAPGIEIIEQQPVAAQADYATEPVMSSIDVLESLVTGPTAAESPEQLARMIQSSIERLLETSARKQTPIGADQAARIVSVAEIIAGWLPGGELDGWARALADRLSSQAPS